MQIIRKTALHSLLSLAVLSSALLSARAEVRQLVFPSAYPMGKLFVIVKTGVVFRQTGRATAIGNVVLNVAPGGWVQLEVNPHCIEDPEKLKATPVEGIDHLRIGYMSMDEDKHVCDKALAAFPNFKNALFLDCFRTDVTDAGIISFKSLAKVTRLMCFMSTIDGSFLKEFKRLQNLEHLNLSHNSIKEENFKYLKELKKLQYLNLQESNMSDAGMHEACKISSLKQLSINGNGKVSEQSLQCLLKLPDLRVLSIGSNKHFTDASIPTLQKLTKLTNLDIGSTKITFAGLEKLKNLRSMKVLKLPSGLKVSEIVQLQKDFPLATLINGGQVSEDVQVQLAPLK